MIDGPMLRDLRISKGLSLRDVARPEKLNHGHLSKMERGHAGRPVTPIILRTYGRRAGSTWPVASWMSCDPGGCWLRRGAGPRGGWLRWLPALPRRVWPMVTGLTPPSCRCTCAAVGCRRLRLTRRGCLCWRR